MAPNRLSLAQQIAQLEDTAPVDYDPEDIGVIGIDPEDQTNEDGADMIAGREHYVDMGPSSIRKLRDSVSDPKYDGVRISRNQLMEGEDDDIDSHLEDEDPESRSRSASDGEDAGNIYEGSPPQSKTEQPLHPPVEPALSSIPSPPPVDDLSSSLKKTREEERKKGKAVSRQLAIYDSLLDTRIRLQKCVSSANRLPDPAKISSYLLAPEGRTAADNMLKEAVGLSDDLFDLRQRLLANESIALTSSPPRKRRKVDATGDEGSQDWEAEVQASSMYAAQLDSSLHPHLLSTLQKWSNKILAIAPSALLPSNRTKFSRSTSSQLKGATQLVEEMLVDREKLIGRTRTWRGKGERIGSDAPSGNGEAGGRESERIGQSGEQGDDVEIFDDTDFYQQLLRDVIDLRNDLNGELGGSDDWRAAQKQKRAKKTVDTKASKGRKLRYEVHEKLQNFMVPVPQRDSWHEEQIDELFASLLGKGFENSAGAVSNGLAGNDHAMDVDAGAQEERLAEQIGDALKGGFRVFG